MKAQESKEAYLGPGFGPPTPEEWENHQKWVKEMVVLQENKNDKKDKEKT